MSPKKKCDWRLVYILCTIAISLALLALSGCEGPEPKFKYGEVVNLKIGGTGQIVGISQLRDDYYKVRIQGYKGPRNFWFYGFELEVAPCWRDPC